MAIPVNPYDDYVSLGYLLTLQCSAFSFHLSISSYDSYFGLASAHIRATHR
ncbi:hypothetical protein B0H13DRAFT_2306858 [Mycena leptocephala]|nr:hypothetical protein B0H13DRAFT_2306858 [Mycena leptocephala]